MGERVLAGSCSGKFFAFDRRNGELEWLYDTARDGQPANFHGNALVIDGRLVVGSDVAGGNSENEPIGHVYSFDVASGRVRWRHAVPGGVISAILHRDGSVYGVTRDGTLLCLRLSDGTLLWQVRPEAETTRHSMRYAPVLYEDRVVFSSVAGIVTAVDADSGTVIWTTRLGDEVNTQLVLGGSSVWLGVMGGDLYRLDAETGKKVATFAFDEMPYGTPVLLDESLLLLQAGNTLARISIADGSVLWRRSAVDEWSSFRPLVLEDSVWVGNGQGELVALALEDGATRRTLKLAGTIRGFRYAEGVFYVGTLEGTLYAVRP